MAEEGICNKDSSVKSVKEKEGMMGVDGTRRGQ